MDASDGSCAEIARVHHDDFAASLALIVDVRQQPAGVFLLTIGIRHENSFAAEAVTAMEMLFATSVLQIELEQAVEQEAVGLTGIAEAMASAHAVLTQAREFTGNFVEIAFAHSVSTQIQPPFVEDRY